MEQQSIFCPWCKRENRAGDRFCRYCGRLLIEPDAEAMSYAPYYSASQNGSTLWNEDPQTDVTHARVVIRAFPADTQDPAGAVAQRVGEYALEGRTVTIGRAQSCDIVFSDDNLTSRRHAILRREEHYYTVADLGSSNGTFLNEMEVREPSPLHHGDRLLIGQHELLFLLEQPHPIAASTIDVESAAAQARASDAADGESGIAPDVAAAAVDASPAQASAQARPTGAPGAAVGETGKYASVARLSSELASSAWRLATPPNDGADLDSMRARLLEASEALTRQAGMQSALAERRRRAIVETRERLGDMIADLRGDDVQGDSPVRRHPPTDLIELAQRVSEDPNDLDHLRALGEHAGELARALRAQAPSEGRWSVERQQTLRALEDMHYRLQERE